MNDLSTSRLGVSRMYHGTTQHHRPRTYQWAGGGGHVGSRYLLSSSASLEDAPGSRVNELEVGLEVNLALRYGR
jgi:hypothetical protein